jgi:flagellar biosynthesis/type III secretory pathway chaperone
MESLLRSLSEILSQEIVQYSKLLGVLSDERRVLVGNSPERINELLKLQNTLILELKALEEARVTVMEKLIEQFQTSAQKLTLAQLALLVEEPFATEYRDLSRQFRELLRRLEQVNQNNAYLIDRSIDNVNTTLRLFAASDPFGLGYSNGNVLKPHHGKRLYKTA